MVGRGGSGDYGEVQTPGTLVRLYRDPLQKPERSLQSP